ncbi:hypothetical protein OAC89_04840 [Deltaproteobacteria bacterium]|nr:hypothetical protein [Deltaproteobacteria bacterium]
MIALLFILTITGLSVLVSYFLSSEPGWLDYYRGGVLGFFLSGVILYILNEKRRKKELKNSEAVGKGKTR